MKVRPTFSGAQNQIVAYLRSHDIWMETHSWTHSWRQCCFWFEQNNLQMSVWQQPFDKNQASELSARYQKRYSRFFFCSMVYRIWMIFSRQKQQTKPPFGCHFSPQKNRPPTFRRHLVEAPKSWRCLSIYIIYVYMLYNVIYVYMNVNECLHECKW